MRPGEGKVTCKARHLQDTVAGSAAVSLLLIGLSPGLARPAPASLPESAGLLFYAKYPHQADTAAVRNPHLLGALFQIYWSEVETVRGKPDWSLLDGWIEPWRRAGKKAALRILWSTSGYWADPSAKRPTPAWVWEDGAVKVVHAPSGTEIPLFWDPVYQRHALAFLREVARRYDGDTAVVFLDMTPGAETNPYRLGTLNDRDTAFPDRFALARASDGRAYDADLWAGTVRRFVDSADGIFRRLPLLVTLNIGGLPGAGSRQEQIGDHCVAAGAYVGQNGLTGGSYAAPSAAKTNFLGWAARSRVFFETLSTTSDGRVGSLLDVMRAAERVQASYLNLYPSDVLKGTPGHPGYDREHEDALRYGHQALQGKVGVRAVPRSRPYPAGPAVVKKPGTGQVRIFRGREPAGRDAQGRIRTGGAP